MLEQRTIIAYHLSSSIGDLIKPLGRRMKQVGECEYVEHVLVVMNH